MAIENYDLYLSEYCRPYDASCLKAEETALSTQINYATYLCNHWTNQHKSKATFLVFAYYCLGLWHGVFLTKGH